MEGSEKIESTLSIARHIQGKYLKDIPDLYPAEAVIMNDLPMEAFLEFAEERQLGMKPIAPPGFSQEFQVKRVFLQFPFGEFLKINGYRPKSGTVSQSGDYTETHEGIYLGSWKSKPFVLSNLFFYHGINQGFLNQFLFTPLADPDVRHDLLQAFSGWFSAKVAAAGPYQIDILSSFNTKAVHWNDFFSAEDRAKEFKAFFDSRLRPDANLIPIYEEALPSVTVVGPSGCGKSFLINILMTEYPDYKFFMFRPSDETNAFSALDFIERSKRFPKRIYVFEELDTLAETMSGLQIWRYLIEEGVEKGSGDVALVLATSSYPEILKSAVEFRPDLFGRVWRFDYPAEAVRKQYLKHLTEGIKLKEDDWKRIIEETDGFSFAWMREAWKEARFIMAANPALKPGEAILDSLRELKSRVTLVRDKFAQGGLTRKFGFNR